MNRAAVIQAAIRAKSEAFASMGMRKSKGEGEDKRI